MGEVKAQQVVLGVLFVGIVLTLAIFILATFQTSFRTDASGTINNETLVSVDTLGERLSVYNYFNCQATILYATNATSGAIINSANYTTSNCAVYAVAGASYNGTNWNITATYTYRLDTAAANASGSAVTSFSNGTPWITIIIVVAFAVIVISLLSTGFRNVEKGNGKELPVY